MHYMLFGIAVFLEAVYILLFFLTIRLPGFRFWPPPSWHSWQFFAAWLMVAVVALNGLWLGALDYESACLPAFTIRWPLVVILGVSATILGVWAELAFGLRAILGLGDKLVTNGPYRYTRNPQYITDSLLIIAFVILVNSWMVGIIGILGVFLNYLAPFTEEPWLEARYGESYLAYKRRVPRFFGRVKEELGR